MKPLGDSIVVEPLEAVEKTKGGIILPDTAKEKPQEAKVVELGTGKTSKDGKKIPFNVKKGDLVLIEKYGGNEVKIDGEEYIITKEEDILAVLEK